ncbi:MAG TPA: hypothetical protein VKE40_09890 [Gemmataceae bacterium]|nr:hypothetical protein [Gemmataceae bacterium]
MRKAHLFVAFAFFAVSSPPALAIDLTKIDRTIAKEPAYKGKPKYCLLVFGPEAKFRVWLVIDGDTLYVDRNGNGDLTEAGEAVARLPEGWFKVGTLTEPDGTRHTDLQLQVIQAGAFPIAIRVGGKRLQCLQVEDPSPGTRQAGGHFAEQPKTAPIVHFNGPLTMKLTYPKGRVWDTRPDNRVVEVVAWLGTPGLGDGTFASIGTSELLACPGPTVEIEFSNRAAGGESIRVKDRLAPDP